MSDWIVPVCMMYGPNCKNSTSSCSCNISEWKIEKMYFCILYFLAHSCLLCMIIIIQIFQGFLWNQQLEWNALTCIDYIV